MGNFFYLIGIVLIIMSCGKDIDQFIPRTNQVPVGDLAKLTSRLREDISGEIKYVVPVPCTGDKVFEVDKDLVIAIPQDFVDPGEEVYKGMIIGENNRPGDLVVNCTEGKKLTNMRASGSDAATNIAPKRLMTLEECMEYIQQDECIEVTPNSIRMRKTILDEEERKKAQRSAQMRAEAV